MGLGAVCHTLNPRLFLADLEYIMNHAEDKIVMFDLDLAGVIAKLRPKLATVQRLVALTDRQHMHKVVSPVSRPASALARFQQESPACFVCNCHLCSAICACACQEGLKDQEEWWSNTAAASWKAASLGVELQLAPCSCREVDACRAKLE